MIRRGEAKEAMKLAGAWQQEKRTPDYVSIHRLNMNEIEESVDLYDRCLLASPDPFCPLTSEQARRLEQEGILVARFTGALD